MNFKKILCLFIACLLFNPVVAFATESDYTEKEIILLARMIYGEARGEDEAGKFMVGQCAFDRKEDGYWGPTLSKVINYSGQFALSETYDEESLDVARRLCNGERFNSKLNILYFQRSKSDKDWYNGDRLYAPYLGHTGPHAYYGYERDDVVPNKELYIIDQSRTKVYQLLDLSLVYREAYEHGGHLSGIALYLESNYLGTFDNEGLAINEINNILNCEDEVYIINR